MRKNMDQTLITPPNPKGEVAEGGQTARERLLAATEADPPGAEDLFASGIADQECLASASKPSGERPPDSAELEDITIKLSPASCRNSTPNAARSGVEPENQRLHISPTSEKVEGPCSPGTDALERFARQIAIAEVARAIDRNLQALVEAQIKQILTAYFGDGAK